MSDEPVIAIIPKGAMSKTDLARLRKVGLVAVECSEAVFFKNQDDVRNISEQAAIATMHDVFNSSGPNTVWPIDHLRSLFQKHVCRLIPMRKP